MHQTLKRAGALSVAALLALTLAACGSSDGSMAGMDGMSSSSSAAPTSASTDAASGEQNEADVMFAQGMIVHHRGALEMAELATTKASSPEVRDLAARITAAQEPEIAQMSGWLESWGETVPTGDDMSSMDMGADMGGMNMEESMTQLDAATGTEFDRAFLEMMTVHHQDAVEMARTESTDGSYPEAVELAGTIETSQTAEIAEMEQLLATLGS